MVKKILYIALILLLAILFMAYRAYASSVGPSSPGTTVDDATVGTLAWANPNNAQASDGVFATASHAGLTTSHYLKATNFGFSIPAGATITGILAEIQKQTDTLGDGKDITVKIVKSDGTLGATNKALATAWPTTEAYSSYGSSSDLWGETWASTDINNANFGIVISESSNDTGGSVESIDHIRITVYYTLGSPQVQIRQGQLKFAPNGGQMILK